MESQIIKLIAVSQGISERYITICHSRSGFSQTTKYVVTLDNRTEMTNVMFAKVIAKQQPGFCLETLKTEASVYKILNYLGLGGKYFPRFIDYIESDEFAVLLVEYLSDTNWNIKWDLSGIKNLRFVIEEIHNTPLSQDIINKIQAISSEYKIAQKNNSPVYHDVLETNKLFLDAWNGNEGAFMNSCGQTYHKCSYEVAEEIEWFSCQCNFFEPQKLILRDLNVGNIAINNDKIVFVDPVYLDVGNPALDIIMLAITVLCSFSANSEANDVSNYVIKEFIKDKPLFAYLTKYWIASAAMPVSPVNEAWRSFQEKYASTALKIWDTLYC